MRKGLVYLWQKLAFIRGVLLVGICVVAGINGFVIVSGKLQMLSLTQLKTSTYQAADVPILVLGAGIINNQEPSGVLAKRLDQAVALANAFPEKSLIMSGDHANQYYNEVQVMKDYLVARGVASQRIYLDHAGYSTYDSLYRLKHVLKQDKAIIVTQGYHLSRALMLSRGLGIQAVGVPAPELLSTRGQRELREIGARLKDFAVAYFKYPQAPPEQGYSFSLTQSGDETDQIPVTPRSDER